MSKLSTWGRRRERESVLLILALAALFVALSLVLSYLASLYGWYFLVTDNEYYTLSGATDAYFERVNSEDKRVEFYFCMNEAELTANPTYGRIYDTVKQFDERYAFFTLSHLDTYYDFEKLERFAKEHDTTLSTQSVITYCPDTGRSFVRDLSTFYFFDAEDTTNDDMVFNGEETVAAMVDRVTRTGERPLVYFTTGHGELSTPSMMNHMFAAGYDIKTADLASNDVEAACSVIVIACPQYDFEEFRSSPELVSEISRLRDFMARGGTVIYFRNAAAGPLPRLDALFASVGLVAEQGVLKDGSASIDPTGTALLLRYADDATPGSVGATAAAYSDARIAAAGVSSLLLADAEGFTVTPLLKTYGTAYRTVGGVVTDSKADGFTVAAMSERTLPDGSRGTAVMIAAETFASSDVMETNGYANEPFLYALLMHTADAAVPIGCGVVLLNTYPLEDMTRGTANAYLAVFAGIIPLAVCAVGIFVLRRRKNR